MDERDPRHGSYAGYTAHQKAGQEPCAACRAARAEYDKKRRRETDWHTCPWCHARTQSTEPLCQTCRGWRTRLNSRGIPTPDDALTGGRWVGKKGIAVWVPDEPDTAA